MEAAEINNSTPPNLIEFSGEWQAYEKDLYKLFLDTIVNGGLVFRGLPVRVGRGWNYYKNKHLRFWHITSEGEKEEERTPDFERCKRLPWISWVISNCDKVPEICCWPKKVKNKKRIILWFNENHAYAVILEERRDCYLLKTHYLIEPHRLKIFRSERNNFLKQRKI